MGVPRFKAFGGSGQTLGGSSAARRTGPEQAIKTDLHTEPVPTSAPNIASVGFQDDGATDNQKAIPQTAMTEAEESQAGTIIEILDSDEETAEASWTCNTCTLLNVTSTTACKLCSAERITGAKCSGQHHVGEYQQENSEHACIKHGAPSRKLFTDPGGYGPRERQRCRGCSESKKRGLRCPCDSTTNCTTWHREITDHTARAQLEARSPRTRSTYP